MSNLGGGIHGVRRGIGFCNTTFGADDAMKRKILRKVLKPNKVQVNGNQVISTAGPFRTAFSQGDFLNRVGQSCGGCNQVNDVNSKILRPKMIDSIRNGDCNTVTSGVTPKDIPLYYGNHKYVCDSSLYTRFKNLSSTNQNYNDSSFGGDNNNGSYTFLMRVRRN